VRWWEVNANAEFSGRDNHASVTLNNEIYIIAGRISDFKFLNDIWKSQDGVNWTPVSTVQPIFSEREGHTAVVLKNEIYVIGGLGSDGKLLNDVWKSPDGVNWSLL